MEQTKECYTVVSMDLKDNLLMRIDVFFDREKMRDFLQKYAENHTRCIVIPKIIDDVDYQVEYKPDQETIKTIHFEDEPEYKVPFQLVKPKDLKDFKAIVDHARTDIDFRLKTSEEITKEDEEFKNSIRNVVSDIIKENSE